MQLFYNNNLNIKSKTIIFDKIETRHIVKVLRKKQGDILNITNGKGLLLHSSITDLNKNNCCAEIIKIEEYKKQHNYNLNIAIAPTKNIERFEWFVEKATEIGIDKITPLLCQHSERKIIKQERIEKIIIAAAKQSLHFNFPVLNKLISFSDFILQKNDDLKLIAHCEDSDKLSFKDIVKPKQNITVLIGPEGDFSKQEINLALQNGYKPISLGKTRLRTETAGIVACQNVAYVNQ